MLIMTDSALVSKQDRKLMSFNIDPSPLEQDGCDLLLDSGRIQ